MRALFHRTINLSLQYSGTRLPTDDISFKKNKLDYFLVYLLVATTGMNFFYHGIQFIVLGLVMTSFLFFTRRMSIDRFLIGYALLFFFIQIGQAFLFSFFSPLTFLGLYVRLLFAYFTVRLVGRKFSDYYINIIYFFAIVSFLFYLPSMIFPDFANFFLDHISPHLESPFVDPDNFYYRGPQHIIIFNFNAIDVAKFYSIGRNSGPFWEPGAFGGFLLVALLFNIIKTKKLNNKKNIIFILAIVSTFSTASYFVLFVLMIFYFFMNKKLRYKIVFIPLIITSAIFAYNELDFLKLKFERSLELSRNVGQTYGVRTRFSSAMLDWDSLKKSPIFGMGRRIETRFSGIDDPYLRHRNNGISYLLVVYGPVIFIFYFFLVFKSFKYLCARFYFNPKFAYYSLIIILLMGFSESYFLRPFFYALTFYHLTHIVGRRKVADVTQNKELFKYAAS